uniref:Lipase_3 domain-containing protein n=1 Tax=Bursaphelenchus xylophilus TaxID=6326 RepID=A0A1I7S5G1_BURXY
MRVVVVFLLSVVIVNGQFDESLAKTKLLQLSAGAYTTTPEKCAAVAFGDANVTKTVTAECGTDLGEWKVCYGYTGVSHNSKAIFLAYRGTVSGIQLFYEAFRTIFATRDDAKIGGKVSAYFYNVYNYLRDAGLNGELTRLANEFPDYQIYVTGHSLGGALASIAAAEAIKVDGIAASRVKIITFGEPRTGDTDYSAAFDSVLSYAYRVINQHDIVPQVPPSWFMNYTHHKTEVWYANGMSDGATYKVCSEDEDPTCEDSNTDLSVLNHIIYYNQLIVTYGAAGCA